MIQEELAVANEKLKKADEALSKKVDEAKELHAKRDQVVQEGRNKQKGIREVTRKVKDISQNINDLEGQKRDLEKARDECIMALVEIFVCSIFLMIYSVLLSNYKCSCMVVY